jgi:hypothetical protein
VEDSTSPAMLALPHLPSHMYLAETRTGRIYSVDMMTNEEEFITVGHIIDTSCNVYIFRDNHGELPSVLYMLGGHGVILEEWMADLFRASVT